VTRSVGDSVLVHCPCWKKAPSRVAGVRQSLRLALARWALVLVPDHHLSQDDLEVSNFASANRWTFRAGGGTKTAR